MKGVFAVKQMVSMRIQTWLKESPYDQTAGLPYLQIIFQPGTTPESIKFILEQAILATPGVTSVDLDYVLDRATRVLTITGTMTGLNEEIPFNLTVSPP